MSTELREGPPRYYRPVCIRDVWEFEGVPSGYEEVGEEDRDLGPIIVNAESIRKAL